MCSQKHQGESGQLLCRSESHPTMQGLTPYAYQESQLPSIRILNNTSNVTDSGFAIFSKLCKTFSPKFRGSAKNI